MIRPNRSGTAFWLFLVLLALAGGWAANQHWQWPWPKLFDWQSEPQEQDVAAQAQGQATPSDQPEVEKPTVEGPIGRDTKAEQPASEGAEPESATASTGEGGDVPVADAPADEPPEEVEEAASAARSAEPQAAGDQAATSTTSVVGIEPGTTTEQSASGAQTSGPLPQESQERAAGEAPPEVDVAPGDGEHDEEVAALAPTPEAAGEAPAATEVVPPSFDVVRVGRDGRAVIAGRAQPGAEVELRAGGQVIDRVPTSRGGEWIAIPGKPLAPGDQELTAVAEAKHAPPVVSEQVVVVAVPGPRSTTPETKSVSVPVEASAPAEPVAVLLRRHGKGPGRILQAPGRLSDKGTLALMTVSYDEEGEVLLSGEAPPGVPVRIYVDNRPAAVVLGDAKGTWSAGLDEALAPGTYMLRVDQLNPEGEPVARIETPFTRVSEPPVEGDLQVDYVVVQPGNSLWRIARRLSGKGLDYVHIYDTNQGQIRDPDLIYPGQVFEIPRDLGSAG